MKCLAELTHDFVLCYFGIDTLVREAGISGKFLSPIGPLSILFFIFNLVAVNSKEPGNIAYISHAIGFVIGLFFGVAWNDEWKKTLAFTIVLLALYIVLYNFLLSNYLLI